MIKEQLTELYFDKYDYETMDRYLSLFPPQNKELKNINGKKLKKSNNQLAIVGRRGCGKTFFVTSTITNRYIHWVTSDWTNSNLETLIHNVIHDTTKSKQTTSKTLALKPIESYFESSSQNQNTLNTQQITQSIIHKSVAIVFDSFDEKYFSQDKLKLIERLVEKNVSVPVIFISSNLDTKSAFIKKASQKIEISFQRQIDNEEKVIEYLKPLFNENKNNIPRSQLNKKIETLIESCDYDLSNIMETLIFANASENNQKNDIDDDKDDKKGKPISNHYIKDKNLEHLSTIDLCRLCIQSNCKKEREEILKKISIPNFSSVLNQNYLSSLTSPLFCWTDVSSMLSDIDILQNNISSEITVEIMNSYIGINYDWIKLMPCSFNSNNSNNNNNKNKNSSLSSKLNTLKC